MTDAKGLGEVQRWSMYIATNHHDDAVVEHTTESDGEWVKYTDHTAHLVNAITQALADAREADAKVVPTNWCDPLLSKLGDPPYWCGDIENLLRAVAAAILKGRT